jgi:hypothetical protein
MMRGGKVFVAGDVGTGCWANSGFPDHATNSASEGNPRIGNLNRVRENGRWIRASNFRKQAPRLRVIFGWNALFTRTRIDLALFSENPREQVERETGSDWGSNDSFGMQLLCIDKLHFILGRTSQRKG